MFSPGDVVWLLSDEANKPKFHLCVSQDNKFLFINSPKKKTYPADFVVPCTDIPCLDPTPDGNSIISCSLLLPLSDAALLRCKAKKRGVVSSKVLQRLIKGTSNNDALAA
jgi:hypothetical protein